MTTLIFFEGKAIHPKVKAKRSWFERISKASALSKASQVYYKKTLLMFPGEIYTL